MSGLHRLKVKCVFIMTECVSIFVTLTLNVPEIHPMSYGQVQEYHFSSIIENDHHNPLNAQMFNYKFIHFHLSMPRRFSKAEIMHLVHPDVMMFVCALFT